MLLIIASGHSVMFLCDMSVEKSEQYQVYFVDMVKLISLFYVKTSSN